jgi:PAS domain S-box-containing protein
MLELLYERSPDAIWLFDSEAGAFVDCNEAAVKLLGADSKDRLVNARPEDLSPEIQPDGTPSARKTIEVTLKARQNGGYRFEWVARRFDGRLVPLEVVTTPFTGEGENMFLVVSRDISERKARESALRESQQLLASVADNIYEAIYRSAPDHQLTFVNRAYLRLFGYDSLAELQSIPRERLYADALARARLLRLLERDGAFSDQEVEYVRRDGSHFWGLASGRNIRNPQTGETAYHVGAITDITERRKTQAELREMNQSLERRIAERTAQLTASEARARTLVEHAPEAIVVFDGVTGQFLFGNENAGRLYGYPPDELCKLTPADVSPEFQPTGQRSEEMAMQKMQEALDGGLPVFEWVHRHTSGRLVPTEVRLVRLPGHERRLLRASIIDNTSRKEAERALRESEEKYRALYSASSLGVILHDEHRYLEANPAAVRMFGYRDEKEMLGLSPRDISPPVQPGGEPSHALAQRYIDECVATGSARFDWVARSVQGKDLPMEVLLTRIELGGRQIIQAVLHDLTARKQAEEELLRALAREKQLGQLKSNFVSMVSHEFRTPLGVILSSAEILDTYFDQLDPAERQEQLRSIQKHTRRMGTLMEEVLLLGMVDSGKLDCRPDELHLEAFARRLLSDINAATENKCRIRFQAEDLEEAMADERLLGHILNNLVSNAVKYSPEGTEVEVSLRREDAHAVFTIRDHGRGIPPEDMPWLFAAFHRGTNVGQTPGSGLGLTIVKRCVELHGGSLALDSDVGRGTTVTVRLPVFNQPMQP